MKYVGSKARIAADLANKMMPFMSKKRAYIEPFCGGCNMIAAIGAEQRVACDSNKYIIAMWIALQQGWEPSEYSKDYYDSVRRNPQQHAPHIVGWLGAACSYSGKWFGGYAGEVITSQGTTRNYQSEARRNVAVQLRYLTDVEFLHCEYQDAIVHRDSVVYCDPPYAGTVGYGAKFDSKRFFAWAREQSRIGQVVFVSEYAAPDDFICIWSREVSSSFRANGVVTGAKKSVEKLFIHESLV